MDNIENKGQNNSQTSKTYKGLSLKPSHEAVFLGVSKKVEKISTAIYMVTDLIDQDDPIKKRLRQISVDLIGQTREMSYAFSGDIYFMIAGVINKAWEMVSLLEVASSVGFVSDMNHKILKGVLIELVGGLRDRQKRGSFNVLEDFKIGESFSDQIELSKKFFETNINDNQDQSFDKGQNIKDKKTSVKVATFPKENISLPKTNISENKVIKQGVSNSERKDQILNIIKEKGDVSVNDIVTSFPGLSSKTIQRELTSLVEENVLKRVGEKRWSRYSIQ